MRNLPRYRILQRLDNHNPFGLTYIRHTSLPAGRQSCRLRVPGCLHSHYTYIEPIHRQEESEELNRFHPGLKLPPEKGVFRHVMEKIAKPSERPKPIRGRVRLEIVIPGVSADEQLENSPYMGSSLSGLIADTCDCPAFAPKRR